MFTVYHYSKVTGEFIGQGFAPKHPFRDEPLVPGQATRIAPPLTGERQAAVFTSGIWQVVADWRGESFWNKETDEKVVFTLGQTPDETMTDIEPVMELKGLENNA